MNEETSHAYDLGALDALQEMQQTVLGWCGERIYSDEEFAILHRVRDALIVRIAAARYREVRVRRMDDKSQATAEA